MAPSIQTYHCICSSLLLASTHDISSLPRRSKDCSLDGAIILPLPPAPAPAQENTPTPLPPSGYTLLLGLHPFKNPTVIRKEDGFERRLLHRCSRCNVVVGYEIVADSEAARLEQEGSGNEKTGMHVDAQVYRGKILYVLPGGIRTTEGMVTGPKIGEGDVEINPRTVAVLGEA